MEEFLASSIAVVFATLIMVLVALVTPLLYASGGYITGWVLVAVFPFAGKWVIDGASALGLRVDMSYLPQIGAALGFVGAFFKSQQTNKDENR